jgi:hypothetical protein
VNCSIFLLLFLAPSIYKHRPAEANSSVVGDESYVGVSDKLPTMSKVKYQDEISCTDANALSMQTPCSTFSDPFQPLRVSHEDNIYQLITTTKCQNYVRSKLVILRVSFFDTANS